MKASHANTSRLLHNMSVAPKTTISLRPSSSRNYGLGIVFSLPRSATSLKPTELVALISEEVSLAFAASDEEMRALLNSYAATLPLSPVAAVTDQACSGDALCTDLVTVATVLAKSSSRVYLRDKEPNLSCIVPGRRVVLIVPKEVKL